MTWEPITENELAECIADGVADMPAEVARFWESIRIPPEKWQEAIYGDEGGGFWAVAVHGRVVVWYNDIEDGFNRSTFSKRGLIEHYAANQDELDITIQWMFDEIRTGKPQGFTLGPPEPVPHLKKR